LVVVAVAAQVEALAEAIAPPYGVLIRLAGYTGLRPCEFVALKVSRLDLLRGSVRVAEAAPGGRRASGVGWSQDP
jgi:integrase